MSVRLFYGGMAMDNRPVGMFDSGVGGISTLAAAVRLLPAEDFLYYGDTKNAPYGEKSQAQILALARRVTETLIENGAKAIVIACNTATGAAAEALRKQYDFPIIGIEPAIKPASLLRAGGIILSLATPLTIHSERYHRLEARYGEGVVSLPCPGLMDFVERGELDSPALDAYIDNLLSPYRGAQIDAVVLGCTHYVFLRERIASHLKKGTPLIDGNEGTARQLKRRLYECGLLSDRAQGGVHFMSSGGGEALSLMQSLYDGIPRF